LKVPTTYNEFIALADALKAKNIAPMTAGGKDGWPVGVVGLPAGLLLGAYPDQQALVKGIWTGQAKFNDAKAQTYFDHGKQLLGYYENGVASIDYQTAPGRFAAGKAAMYPGGTWDAPTILAANPKMNLGYFPFPASDNAADNKSVSGKYDVQWYVPAKSPNKAAALAWLDFFSQQDNYSAYVNAVGILSNQPSVNLNADYAKEITPYLPTFKVAFSEMMLSPKNVGKYAGFALNNFTPFGDVSDPKDLAQKSEADWESALPK
jgi:raffinose/stachyose/melibiose transport system substrate-binding protein